MLSLPYTKTYKYIREKNSKMMIDRIDKRICICEVETNDKSNAIEGQMNDRIYIYIYIYICVSIPFYSSTTDYVSMRVSVYLCGCREILLTLVKRCANRTKA